MNEPDGFLAHLLGPHAENADVAERLLLEVFRDHVHWRRNYFPEDDSPISSSTRRALELQYDVLESAVQQLTAGLRRNFPFYSPRYVGHQLSEVTLPSLLGGFAGMLYNPNNVTTEAAPVTVDWEIQACSEILSLLGFTPPPPPPRDAAAFRAMERSTYEGFGWAHLTSGGTVANIEALWVARNAAYLPLAVKDVARSEGLDVAVRLPSAATDERGALVEHDVRSIDDAMLLRLKPNEAIYLHGRLVGALHRARGVSAADASRLAHSLLRDAPRSVSNGLRVFADHPPVILVSGAAHYSISKAADVLGIGRNNVVLVETDSSFRMRVDDLERTLEAVRGEGRVPIAVVAIAGTTEEGAVDPIHDILDLRESLEAGGSSFWLHVDAAWGGYFRTLLQRDDGERRDLVLTRLGARLGHPYDGDPHDWHRRLAGALGRTEGAAPSEGARRLSALDADAPLERYLRSLRQALAVPGVLEGLVQRHPAEPIEPGAFQCTLEDLLSSVSEDTRSDLALEFGEYRKDVEVHWGDRDVCSALLAMRGAESVTVDPHKMGYMHYPIGVVAFRNDRVRYLLEHEARYISSAERDALRHQPPQHVDEAPEEGARAIVKTDAFGPFILEGSRPGSAAAALYLSHKVLPLDRHGLGALVRSSALAARELYEWLVHWPAVSKALDRETSFELVPCSAMVPDTNLVVFTVKDKESSSLRDMNDVSESVYRRFSIQAELGDRSYSYSQPFFVSHTPFREPGYALGALRGFFDRAGIEDADAEYAEHGVWVLRASLMNPYITPLRTQGLQQVIRDFIAELARVAEREVQAARKGGAAGPDPMDARGAR